MSVILKTLKDLEADSAERIIRWVTEKLSLTQAKPKSCGHLAAEGYGSSTKTESLLERSYAVQFEDFADLFDAAQPSTDVERALVAGHWVQNGLGNSDFVSQAINDELKQLGHPVSNITRALGSLIDARPALVQQLRKDGGSKQARKTYRLTKAGLKKIEEMCAGRK